jgi:hypothetical protein
MFPMKITIVDDLAQAGLVPKRQFNGIFARSLKAGMAFWHGKHLPGHFERSALVKYSGHYPGKKVIPGFLRPGKKKPLVRSGTLRRRVLSKKQLANIRGTSKGVSMTLHYGRPKALTKKLLRRSILIMMHVEKLTYEQASQRVFSKAGYGARNAAIFQDALTATTEREGEEIAEAIRDAFFEEAKQRGKRKTDRIK